MMRVPLNLELLKSPVNYLIVGLMVAIAALGMNVLFQSTQPEGE